MDGLLIDSERVVRDAMMVVANQRGRSLPLEIFLQMVGRSAAGSRAVAVAHFGADFNIEEYDAAVEVLVDSELGSAARLKPGVEELLDHLKLAHIPCAVVTSSSYATVERHLGRNGILGRFRIVVAAGDYENGKPSPDPYLEAATRLGVDPRSCLALEDSHNGVRAAHAAGMMTVMVPDLLDATEEMRSLCVSVVTSLHGVRDVLAAGAERAREVR